MKEIITTLSAYTGLFALLGFMLGILIRDLGTRRRIEAGRSEGTVLARTSVGGDTSLQAQIEGLVRERDRLSRRVEALTAKTTVSPKPRHETGRSVRSEG